METLPAGAKKECNSHRAQPVLDTHGTKKSSACTAGASETIVNFLGYLH
jgi:hypothetical protein